MKSKSFARLVLLLVLVIVLESSAREPQKHLPATPVVENKIVRARNLGIPFEGTPGKFNAITDVAGVEVGYTTLISSEGALKVGEGPVRTGVTAILPRGHDSLNDPVYAAFFSLNGNGEMTGTAWVEESGFLEGPIVVTNTHSVGVARDAVIAWRIKHGAADKVRDEILPCRQRHAIFEWKQHVQPAEFFRFRDRLDAFKMKNRLPAVILA